MANAKVTYIGPPGQDYVPKMISTLGYTFHYAKPTLVPMSDTDAIERLRKNPSFEVDGNFKELDRKAAEEAATVNERLAQSDDNLRAERDSKNAAAAFAQQQQIANAAADRRRNEEAKVAKLQAEQKEAARLRDHQTSEALARQVGAPPRPAA